MINNIKKELKKYEFLVYVYDKTIETYYKLFSAKSIIKKKFKKEIGREVELENPVDFRDKIQWLKLNWFDSKAALCADKYEVRRIVRKKIGDQILNELYGVYNSIDEIDLKELPDSFVLKGTHGSGFNLICHDKSKIQWNDAFKKMKRWLHINYYWKYREWVYKEIKPRIICEKYLQDDTGSSSLTDYKFYCFNGDPIYCQVIKNRETGGTIDFFDKQWNHMPFRGLHNWPNSSSTIPKPKRYNEMIEYARKLSEGFPFVRVDFYYVKDQIYFGELTFFPKSGLGSFYPTEWNKKIGSLLKLPE